MVPAGTFWFTAAWASEPSVMHHHPAWGPALERGRYSVNMLHRSLLGGKNYEPGKLWALSQGKANLLALHSHISSLSPPFPSSGSCLFFIRQLFCTSWTLDAEIDEWMWVERPFFLILHPKEAQLAVCSPEKVLHGFIYLLILSSGKCIWQSLVCTKHGSRYIPMSSSQYFNFLLQIRKINKFQT